MPPALTMRTAGPWGPGTGADLNPADVDNNFWQLALAIAAIVASPGSPKEFSSIAFVGGGLVFTLSDGGTIGPVPVPIASWNFRGPFVPSVPYAVLDTFFEPGVGLFTTKIPFTAGLTFDPNVLVGGLPALQLLFGVGTLTPTPVAFSTFYPGIPPAYDGTLGLVTIPVPVACQFPANFAGDGGVTAFSSVGKALAATALSVITVKKISGGVTTPIGTVSFAISSGVPAFATTGGLAQAAAAGDFLELDFPSPQDASLADIALSLMAVRL